MLKSTASGKQRRSRREAASRVARSWRGRRRRAASGRAQDRRRSVPSVRGGRAVRGARRARRRPELGDAAGEGRSTPARRERREAAASSEGGRARCPRPSAAPRPPRAASPSRPPTVAAKTVRLTGTVKGISLYCWSTTTKRQPANPATKPGDGEPAQLGPGRPHPVAGGRTLVRLECPEHTADPAVAQSAQSDQHEQPTPRQTSKTEASEPMVTPNSRGSTIVALRDPRELGAVEQVARRSKAECEGGHRDEDRRRAGAWGSRQRRSRRGARPRQQERQAEVPVPVEDGDAPRAWRRPRRRTSVRG